MHFMTKMDERLSSEVTLFMVRDWLREFVNNLERPRLPVTILNVNELRFSRFLFDPTVHGISLLLYTLVNDQLLTTAATRAWIRLAENEPEPNDFALVLDALMSLDELGELKLTNAKDSDDLTLACIDLYGENIIERHIKASGGRYKDNDEVPGYRFYHALEYIQDSFFEGYNYSMLDLIVQYKLSFLDLEIQDEQCHGLFTICEKTVANALKDLSEDSLESLDRDATYDHVFNHPESDNQFSVNRFHPLRGGGFSCISRYKPMSSPLPTRLLV